MKTTIDGAGRIVVPKPLRDALGVQPGQVLELEVRDGQLQVDIVPVEMRLEPGRNGPVAVPADKLPTLTGTGTPDPGKHPTVTVVDTSVVIAAFASWHEQHDVADDTVSTGVQLVAHCAIEALSVLTRLPPPHRAPGHLVRDFLSARFPSPCVVLDANGYSALIPRLVELGISGGAVYDALIAATASAASATLVTCDRRAVQVYDRLGVDYKLLSRAA